MIKSRPLIRMSDLARQSGVPAATIKHYIREGLIPEPPMRTSRNMAWYDASVAPRVKAIKELQRTRFLPLKVIREILEARVEVDSTREAAAAIERTLVALSPAASRTRAELVESGMPARELDWFVKLGIVSARGEGDDARFEGDDLELLRTLGRARRAGITPEMLPFTSLAPYLEAIRSLVRVELEMFRAGVVPLAKGDLSTLTEAATTLSEKLVVLMRRRFLVPMLEELARSETSEAPALPAAGAVSVSRDATAKVKAAPPRRSKASPPRARRVVSR